VAGGGAAALALFAIAWAMLRYSRRLPIGQFFRYSSILIAVLAVVLIGKAVSALQEAGYLPVTWFQGGWRVEILGLYPTLQGIAAQVGMASLLVVGFILAGRSRPPLKLRHT
jgi:high-affinity iron transporter